MLAWRYFGGFSGRTKLISLWILSTCSGFVVESLWGRNYYYTVVITGRDERILAFSNFDTKFWRHFPLISITMNQVIFIHERYRSFRTVLIFWFKKSSESLQNYLFVQFVTNAFRCSGPLFGERRCELIPNKPRQWVIILRETFSWGIYQHKIYC